MSREVAARCSQRQTTCTNHLLSRLLCDQTIAVTAPLELRVRRIMARDGITEQYARLRISAQKADEYYRSKCDCELTNSADTAEAFQADAQMFFHRMVEAIREEKRHGTT